jgi:AbrB family looped-hinge helix DNA binding protein
MDATVEIATVTSKGQVTIPIEVRKDMGLIPGSKIDFIHDQDGTWRVVKKRRSIMEFAGVLKWKTEPISIEAMDKVAKQRVADNYLESLMD